MVRIKLDTESLKLAGLFESLTGVFVRDCVVSSGGVVFVVGEGEVGRAVGRRGCNVSLFESQVGKRVEVVEFCDDPVRFVLGLFSQVGLGDVFVSESSDGRVVLNVSVGSGGKGLVRSRLKRFLPLLKKYYGVDRVRVV